MKTEPYILDDRCIISEEVKKMSKEERQREIERLEMEGRKEREHLRRKKNYQMHLHNKF